MLFSSVDCKNNYFGLTTRQLKKRVKELIPACIDNFLKLADKEKEKESNKSLNANKNSAIPECLVKNQGCAKKFKLIGEI